MHNEKFLQYKIIYLKIDLNICKNLNPFEVVFEGKYYITVFVTVMAFYLMVFYENLYTYEMEYQNSLHNL